MNFSSKSLILMYIYNVSCNFSRKDTFSFRAFPGHFTKDFVFAGFLACNRILLSFQNIDWAILGLRRHPGGGILEEESWRRNPGRGILGEESWRRNLGRGILEEESWRRNPRGNFGEPLEPHEALGLAPLHRTEVIRSTSWT